MTPHVNRPALLAIVEAILAAEYSPAPPAVYWTEKAGEFYGRDGKLGSFVALTIRSRRQVGQDDVSYDKGLASDDTFATKYTGTRAFTLSIRCESDAVDEANTAHEILECIASRLVNWRSYYTQLAALGVAVHSVLSVVDQPGKWDRRSVTGAVLDLSCSSCVTEVDANLGTATTSGGSDFFRELDGDIQRVPEEG